MTEADVLGMVSKSQEFEQVKVSHCSIYASPHYVPSTIASPIIINFYNVNYSR